MELLGNDDINTELSGTTMVLVVICNSKMIIANIGDSRAVLGRSSQLNGLVDQELALSIDHKPCSPFERYRITSMGGRVFPIRYSDGIVGPERVWLGNRNSPGLAMSRSLCDTVAHEAGVISTPDIFERAIDAPSDRVLILATDGLWDVMTNMEVTSLCAAKSEPSAAVSALIKEARTRWFSKSAFMDDTTVCVVFFHGSVPAI